MKKVDIKVEKRPLSWYIDELIFLVGGRSLQTYVLTVYFVLLIVIVKRLNRVSCSSWK